MQLVCQRHGLYWVQASQTIIGASFGFAEERTCQGKSRIAALSAQIYSLTNGSRLPKYLSPMDSKLKGPQRTDQLLESIMPNCSGSISCKDISHDHEPHKFRPAVIFLWCILPCSCFLHMPPMFTAFNSPVKVQRASHQQCIARLKMLWMTRQFWRSACKPLKSACIALQHGEFSACHRSRKPC